MTKEQRLFTTKTIAWDTVMILHFKYSIIVTDLLTLNSRNIDA